MNLHTQPTTSSKTARKFIWSDENLTEAARLWAQGFTASHIAKVFGTSDKSMSVMMVKKRDMFPKRERGSDAIPVSKRGRWIREKIDHCVRLARTKMTQKDIAAEIGMTRGAVAFLMTKRADLFAVKTKPEPKEIVILPQPARRTYIAGKWVEHVKRTTISGAVVTLPRVSFIDGVREGG